MSEWVIFYLLQHENTFPEGLCALWKEEEEEDEEEEEEEEEMNVWM